MRLFPLIAILFVPLLAMPCFGAAGFSMPSLEQRTILFEPGVTHEWTFFAKGNDYLEVQLGGALAEYAELIDPDPEGGPRSVTMRLTLPEELPAGSYRVWLDVLEAAPSGGATMGGRAAVRGSVIVRSLYDWPFLRAKMGVDDTSEGKATQARLILTSWSTVPITNIESVISVHGEEELLSFPTPKMTLQPDAEETISVPLLTGSLPPGNYHAEALVTYDDNETGVSTTFRIGTLSFSLEQYTKKLAVGQANRFTFRVNSNWNGKVEGVHGVVHLAEQSEQTPTIDIQPFAKGDFKTFIDLTSATPGSYQGEIVLLFNDKEQAFPIEVELVEGGEEAQSAAQESGSLVAGLDMLPLLYLGLFILVVINLVLLWRSRKSK